MDKAESLFLAWLPTVITLAVFAALLWTANWLLFKRNIQTTHENSFFRQLLMLLLCIMSVVALVIALPIKESTETQILSLIGLLLSGLLAFSSTTIVSNLVAGTMMRFTQPFRTGDFIRVEGYSGRVTERGLFDCEVQTENRELVAIPNNYMINNPVTVVRSSGTIISVSLSLGYDVHHNEVEKLLKEAAEQAELQDPYVHITELGNFAVSYKVSGLLLEVKNLLTARSRLFRHVLDTLHGNNIEIMSASFMNQRKVPDETMILPRGRSEQAQKEEEHTVAEDIVFDKAEEAEQLEKQSEAYAQTLVELKQKLSEASAEQKTAIEQQIVNIEQQIESHKEAMNESDKKD